MKMYYGGITGNIWLRSTPNIICITEKFDYFREYSNNKLSREEEFKIIKLLIHRNF